MNELSDVNLENDSEDEEIESPVDGPPPDWMRAATSSKQSSFSEEKAPDWLKSIRAGKGGSSPTPEPMPESEATSLSASIEDEGMSDLERLLAEEGIDLGTVAEERPEGSEGMSAKDWLIATSDDDLVRKRLDTEPLAETVVSKPAPPVEQPTALAEEDDGMSDLERLLAEEGIDLNTVAEERPEGSEGMSAKDWLISTSDDDLVRKRLDTEPMAEVTPPEPAPTVSSPPLSGDKLVVEDDLPDWLQELSDDNEPAFAEVAAPAATTPTPAPVEEDDLMVVEDDLPDWLQELSDDDELLLSEEGEKVEEEKVTPIAEAVTTAEDEGDKMVVSEDLPDWLQEVEDIEVVAAPAAQSASSPTDDDLPDWLNEAEFEPEAEPVAISSRDAGDDSIEEEGLPDWLQEVEDEAVGPPVAGVAETPDGEELPDWLQEVQQEQEEAKATPTPSAAIESAEEELPDWLQEEELETVTAHAEDDSDLDESDDLPDWLQDVEITEEEELFEPSEPSPDPFTDEVDLGADEELPTWLQEVQQETKEEVIPEAQPVASLSKGEESLGEEELPDWLQEVKDEEVERLETTSEVTPDLEPEPSLEAEPIAEMLSTTESPEEEMPDWLSEVASEEPTPAMAQPASSRGEIPDWLQKLREGGAQEKIASSPPLISATPIPAQQSTAHVVSVTPRPAPVIIEPEAVPADLPADPEERLGLAQAARDTGDVTQAVRIYTSLVTVGAHLNTVIADAKQMADSDPNNHHIFQLMGDAMMRDGRLQSALQAYRKAMQNL
jgi:hypothetical protein